MIENGRSWLRVTAVSPGPVSIAVEPSIGKTFRAKFEYRMGGPTTLVHLLELGDGEPPAGRADSCGLRTDGETLHLTIGRHAFIGAGAVVTKDVPDYALMAGVPAKRIGWMSRHGARLSNPDAEGIMVCSKSGWKYKETEPGVLRCLDWAENKTINN